MKNIFFAYLHSCGISQKKLFQIFGEGSLDPQIFFEKLDIEKLKNYFPEAQIEKILQTKAKLNLAQIDSILGSLNVELISIFDASYPEILKNIANPPFLLYLRGKLDNSPKLAVVGSRSMTQYGEKSIEKLLPELTPYFSIVSGGASGCDTKAHQTTLKHKGKTIAVIGTGIDGSYPASNKKLFEDILIAGGAIISIFPLFEGPQNYNFPIRNEIISGLSNGVIVVEAGAKSGTLITAGLTLDQGRDLFAIPGDIFKQNSFGCNQLIKKGEAKMLTSLQDILEEYNFAKELEKKTEKPSHFETKIESDIYYALVLESLSIDELSKKLGYKTSEISIAISLLEIGGIVKKVQNANYEVC